MCAYVPVINTDTYISGYYINMYVWVLFTFKTDVRLISVDKD